MPGLHYSLGLALVRLKRADEALDELRKAAELDAGQARYAYVYAVAQHSAGLGQRGYGGPSRKISCVIQMIATLCWR